MAPGDFASAVVDTPGTVGLFTDFDGTLSEIVDQPGQARPISGVVDSLRSLSQRLRIVAVVSGRTATELMGWFGSDFELWGLYGAERAVDGDVRLAERAKPYRGTMRAVLRDAASAVEDIDIDGVFVEDKGIGLGLHWRRSSDRAAAGRALTAIANDLASRHHLHVAEGKFALELLPPVSFAKGDVVRERVAQASLEAVGFVGDDLGDLTAFDALDELAQRGTATIRVAVRSAESPPELLRRGDVIVDGPEGTLRWLRSLEPDGGATQ